MTDDFVGRLRKRVDEAVAREAQQQRAKEQEQRARNQAETERLERATALLRHFEQRGQVLRGAAIPGVEYQVAEAEEPWGFTHQVHWTASHPPRGLWVQVDQLGSRLRWAWALGERQELGPALQWREQGWRLADVSKVRPEDLEKLIEELANQKAWERGRPPDAGLPPIGR